MTLYTVTVITRDGSRMTLEVRSPMDPADSAAWAAWAEAIGFSFVSATPTEAAE